MKPPKPTYEHYKAVDFLTDDEFVGHQLEPTDASTSAWTLWLQSNPANRNEWDEAVLWVSQIRAGLEIYIETDLPEVVIQQLLQRIRETNRRNEIEVASSRTFRIGPFAMAASVVFVLGFLGFMIWQNLKTDIADLRQSAATGEHQIEKKNTSEKVMTIELPDSSVIELMPGSTVAYSREFNRVNREVQLSGEAVFEVRRNERKPFLVFANQVVTKVLGTKFTVRALTKEKDVTVNVLSGQVSVYRKSREKDDREDAILEDKGLILLPNQKAVFSRESEEFNKTLVDQPRMVSPPSLSPSFEYDATPVAEVFAELEKSYGIAIRFSEERLRNCQLSASIRNESFDEKLEIICKTINASYQRFDGQIIIDGGGCK